MLRTILTLIVVTSQSPRSLYGEGVTAMQAGHVAQARDLFSQAATLAPDWALPTLELGVALLSLDPNQSAVAATALERAVHLEPTNARAHFQLARAYRALGRPADATRSLHECVTLRPRWTDAWMALGDAADAQGDTTGAIAAFEQVRVLNPDHAGAVGRLADLYERHHDVAKAEACWLAIVRNNPTVPYYYYQLAQFYLRVDQPDKARQAQQRAALLDPRPARKMRRLR